MNTNFDPEQKLATAYRNLKKPKPSFLDFQIIVGEPPSAKHKLVNMQWTVAHPKSLNVTYKGEVMTLKRACSLADLNYSTAKSRLQSGKDWLI